MSETDLVEAYRAANGPQAHLVANFLQEAGIPAFVDGEESGGGAGGFPIGWTTAPKVLVPAGQAEHARSLIAAAENLHDDPLPDTEDLIEDDRLDVDPEITDSAELRETP